MSISNIKLSEETPFLIIARVKVKYGKQKEYIKLVKEIDDLINETEPGMLYHDLNHILFVLVNKMLQIIPLHLL